MQHHIGVHNMKVLIKGNHLTRGIVGNIIAANTLIKVQGETGQIYLFNADGTGYGYANGLRIIKVIS